MHHVALSIAAYVLLAVESTLADGRGTFAWLLLPWLAVTLKPKHSVIAAFAYGLLLDCLSNGHPGIFVTVTVLATGGLRCLIQQSALSTGPRIALTCFTSSLIASLAVQAALLGLQSRPIELQLLTDTALPCSVGAVALACTVTILRRVRLQPTTQPHG